MKLDKKIASAYMGSRIMFDNKTQGVLQGVQPNLLMDLVVLEGMDNNTPIYKDWCSADSQLILKSLSDMTEEDAIIIANIACRFKDDVPFESSMQVSRTETAIKLICCDKKAEVYIYFNGDVCVSVHGILMYMPLCNIQEITDTMRELGYDCGYGKIKSLIKEGVAVDAKNVK